MLLGMPVIVANTGGVGSLLDHDKEGILYPDNDQYLLASHLVELYKDSNKAALLGCNARVRAIKRHNPQEILNRLQEIYLRILEKEKTKTKTATLQVQ
jgi:glycosyltransferase involved in cell wall biosynthesis